MQRIRSTTAESDEILLENYDSINDQIGTQAYTQFEEVVNHLYNSVFVYFNEGTKKDVLQIIWSTLPSDIYVKYYNRNDRWSRDCILEAFRENENCISDAIEESINNLTNCKNIPYVSEATILFLAKREKESLSLSTTNELCPSLVSSTTNIATRSTVFSSEEKSEQKKSYLKRKRCEIIDIPNDKLKRSGFCAGPWYASFLAIIVILALFLITFYMMHKITVKLNQIPQETPGVFANRTINISKSCLEELSSFKTIPMKYQVITPVCITTVVVRNYVEYKNILLILAAGQKINLTILIEDPQHWPHDTILDSTDNIVDLSIKGAVNTEIILSILNSTPKIKSLMISNSLDYLCNVNNKAISYNGNVISLPDLELMHIDSLIECEIFYEKLLKYTIIENLHTFRLARSVVTENNLQHIQNFIKKSKNKIESLEFPETVWNAPIFDYHIGTLPKIHYLHIDFIYEENKNNFSINKYIDIFFPNLISFTSSYGYLPITKFRNLSDCKSLQFLKIRVLIPESQTKIQMNTMKSFFPQLQNASIYFKFESWDSKNECSIEGIQDMVAKINSFKIRSNCPMAIY